MGDPGKLYWEGKIWAKRWRGDGIEGEAAAKQKALGGSWGGWSRVAGGLPKMSREVTAQVSRAHEDFNTEVKGEPLEGIE